VVSVWPIGNLVVGFACGPGPRGAWRATPSLSFFLPLLEFSFSFFKIEVISTTTNIFVVLAESF